MSFLAQNIQILNDPREVAAVHVHLRLDELRRRRGDEEEPTPKVEVNLATAEIR